MHTEFTDFYNFLKNGIYPKTAISKGDKSNFRRKAKPLVIEDNELHHLSKSRVKVCSFFSTHNCMYIFIFCNLILMFFYCNFHLIRY